MKSSTSILNEIKRVVKKNILNIMFFLTASVVLSSSSISHNEGPIVVFFDVGQGDSILIQQGNFQVLVDGGPDDSVVYKLPRYLPLYDKNIELIVLTHPHDDHIKGLLNVLEEYDVEKVIINRIEYENKGYKYLLNNYSNIISDAKEGDNIAYGDIDIDVIFPFDEEREQFENINNESIVLLVDIKGYQILLMGDAEQEIEKEILGEWDLGEVYILKVGHHCSRTATSNMFLKTISPDLAICSCGERNKFGHPHYETLEKFQKANVQYLVTYEEGDILINFVDL